MADKDGTGRRKKKAKRQTIRVPSDEVPRRPATGPTMAVVRPEDEEDDLGLDGSIEVRLTPVPDPPGPLIPEAPQARQKTIVDMELPAGLLEMFGESEDDAPAPARAPAPDEPADLAVDVEVVDGDAPGRSDRPPAKPVSIPSPAPAPPAQARPFAPAGNSAGPVVVVAPIRSVGEPVPEPASPPAEAEQPAAPRPARAKRAPTQPGITRVSLPAEDTGDDGWSVPEASPSRRPVAALEEREAPMPDEATEESADEGDDLASEPTRVRRSPSEPPVSIETVPIEVADVEPEAAREERDSDPPTPIEVDASDEVGLEPSAGESLSAGPKLSLVSPLSPTPVPAPTPPPPPPGPPHGGRPGPALTPLPMPPPVPVQIAQRGEPPERDTAVERRKKPKRWWEDFFGDDYLRTVPRISEEYTARECDFIEASLSVDPGAKLLDLGCGPGRQAVDLAGRGYDVVGLDLSLAMLTRAQALADTNSHRVNFMQADMRELTFDSAFDGVLCMGTTFGLFDDESNVQVIRNIHRALKENGALLVEVANRDFVLRGQPNLIWFEGDGCVCMEETTVNFITSRLHVKRAVILDDGGQKDAEYSVRLFSLHELGRLLHDNGFRVTEVSGHFSTRGAFFGYDSPRLIILAEKRAVSETTSPGKDKAERDSD
ncbi:MAG: methyltransferase domain-containing protein [Deltaproteobacteria bacterium]|nr:methyltransferase domain-containing protein [Deltaproteobacteria bacterium]